MKIRRFTLQLGLTLVELLICLTIVALVCCFTAPFTPSLFQKSQSDVLMDDIRNAIHYAKLQAVLRGHRLILMHQPDTVDWSSGMALYEDQGKLKKQLIHEWRWPTFKGHVIWHGLQSKHYLRFEPDLNQSTVNGTFVIEMNQHKSLKLVVNRLGRVI